MSDNTVEYLIRLKDEFTGKMQAAAGVAAKGGAAIGQGLATAALAGLHFKDQISAGWDVLNGNYAALGTVLGALPGPLGEIGQIAGSVLGKMIQETEDAAEGYRKLSNATGASVEFLSGFKEAADDVRVSSESVDSALLKFSKGLGGIKDVSEGAMESGKGVAGTLKDLGISAGDAEGNMRPMAALLPEVAAAFSRMADGPAKTAIAIQLFGKQGAELIPILNKGKEGLDEMMKSAEAAGLTMSGKTIDAVNKLKEAQDALGDSALAFGRKVGTAAIPALAAFIDKINFLIGVQGTYSDKTADATAALVEFNKTGELSAATLEKLKAGGNDTVGILKGMADSTASESAGLGVLAGVTTTAAQELQKAHPELFKLSEGADKAAKSTEGLGVAQKDAATIQAEYQTKVVDLTSAMDKRDKGLEEIKDKEEKLTEAERNGFISKEQLTAAQAHLQDQTSKVSQEFDTAAGKIKAGAESTEAMGKAAEGAVANEKNFQSAMKDAAAAAEDLKNKTDALTGGFGKMPEKMDAAAKAAMAWKLATGQITVAQSEQTLVAQGLTAQYVNHKITLAEMVNIGKDYASGAITADQALQKSGAWRAPATIAAVKGYREIEGAAGVASQSELAHADYIRVTTRILSSKKVSLDDVAEAQLYLNKANEADSKMLKESKIDLDAKKISELDYTKVTLNVSEAHDKLASSTRKVEDAFHKGQGTTIASTIITDNYGLHLEDIGYKLDEFGHAVKNIPETKTLTIETDNKRLDITNEMIRKVMGLPPLVVTVDSNTTGFTTGVEGAKGDAKTPVVIPVTVSVQTPKDAMNSSILGGGDKTGKPFAISVPVTIDTTGMDAQVKTVQTSLDKLTVSKNISIAVDYTNVTSAFKTINDTKLSSKTVTIYGDYDKTMNGRDGVIDVVERFNFTDKVVMIDADETNANLVFDSVNAEVLDSKSVDIFGKNGAAMSAIAAVKAGLDSIHDKTVFINVQQTAAPPPSSGGNSGGGGTPPDERRGGVSFQDNTTVTNNTGFGKTSSGVKLADNIYIRSDLDLEVLAVRVADLITGRG